jgi:hypothetical protein
MIVCMPTKDYTNSPVLPITHVNFLCARFCWLFIRVFGRHKKSALIERFFLALHDAAYGLTLVRTLAWVFLAVGVRAAL